MQIAKLVEEIIPDGSIGFCQDVGQSLEHPLPPLFGFGFSLIAVARRCAATLVGLPGVRPAQRRQLAVLRA